MPPSASAVDFFQLFVPDNVLKNMVVQTNMYARKFQERFGSDGAWVEVTLAEMKAFLGYVISTSVSHCESVLSIWSGGFYSNRSLALVMSQARFEKILKYFHVVAFRSSQTTHGLYKVQPFLDSLQSGFDAAFRPSQTQVRPWGTWPLLQLCYYAKPLDLVARTGYRQNLLWGLGVPHLPSYSVWTDLCP